MDKSTARGWFPESLSEAIVAEVQAERAARDLTIDELADLAKVKSQAFGRYLRREREMPTAVLWRVAAALGMPASVLVGRAEERLRLAPDFMERHLSGPPT